MLECSHFTFIIVFKNKYLHSFYDLWHAHLEHVNHYVISLLNKKGHIYLVSLLPSLTLYRTCQPIKIYRLPYSINEHRFSHILDRIHYDIWGLSPVKSNLSFSCYVLFVDDYSWFTWLYPMRFKFYFLYFYLISKIHEKSTFYLYQNLSKQW